MDTDQAIVPFSALAQPTRLEVFRLRMEYEPNGLPAREIARRIAVPHSIVPHNTMSTHLAILTRAGLIEDERQSRSIGTRALLYCLIVTSLLGPTITWLFRIETTGVSLEDLHGKTP
jgi:DNA-binding transcriptional ArsR family regulator